MPRSRRSKNAGTKRSQEVAFEDDEWQPSSHSENDEDYNPGRAPPAKRRKTSNRVSKENASSNGNRTSGKSKKSKKAKKSNKAQKAAKITQKSVNEVKKILNQHVRQLAKMVNLNWHDGYEEQGEELIEWYNSLQCGVDIIEKYILDNDNITSDIAIKCNEILKIMNDSWNDMCAIPMRGSIEETMCDCDGADCVLEFKKIKECSKTFSSTPHDLVCYMWRLVLLAAASVPESAGMTKDILMRMIKDADDNGVKSVSDFSKLDVDDELPDLDLLEEGDKDAESEEKNESVAKSADGKGAQTRTIIDYYPALKSGVGRLTDLYDNHKGEWSQLANKLKKHRMRRAIDRRFDGELHLRTRDYHLYQDGDDDCCIM